MLVCYITHNTQQTSTDEILWGLDNLDNKDKLYRALAFHIVVLNSFVGTDNAHYVKKHIVNLTGYKKVWIPSDVRYLHKRIKNVKIYNKGGLSIINKLRNEKDSVMYIDPPYAGADTKRYSYKEPLSKKEYIRIFRKCKGFVAISGIDDNWNDLGWNRYERSYDVRINADKIRTYKEVLWTNDR